MSSTTTNLECGCKVHAKDGEVYEIIQIKCIEHMFCERVPCPYCKMPLSWEETRYKWNRLTTPAYCLKCRKAFEVTI